MVDAPDGVVGMGVGSVCLVTAVGII